MKVDYFALIMQRENMLLVGIVLLLLTNSAVNGALISVLRLKPSSHRGKTIFIYTRLSQNFLFNSLHSIFSEYLGKPLWMAIPLISQVLIKVAFNFMDSS